jgi:hypothetical protein
MPARVRKTHQDDVREKIRTSQLVNRLENHALGKLELSATQIKAIEVLIRKTLPDLSSVTGDLNVNHDWTEFLAVARTRALAEQQDRETIQ